MIATRTFARIFCVVLGFLAATSEALTWRAAVLDPAPPAVDPSLRFSVADLRPKEDAKEGYMRGGGICASGILRIGDRSTQPHRIELLSRDLVSRLGPELSGKQLQITHYGLYLNYFARELTETGSIYDFPQNKRKVTMGSPCPQEQMKGGFYGPWEVNTEFSPVVLELTASLDGQEFKIRVVESTPRELSSSGRSRKFDEPEYSAAIFNAMRKAADELAAAIAGTANT